MGAYVESILMKKEIYKTRLGRLFVGDSIEIARGYLHRYFKNKFQLIITDHTMPNLTGTELSKKVLEIKPEQSIIMCTGYSENVTQEKALKIGIKEFIIKPLTMSNIATAIRKVLDNAYVHQSQ